MFTYKGIYSELEFMKANRRDLPKIINYLFKKYNVTDKLVCEIVLHDRDKPETFEGRIALSTDVSLSFYQQIDFQFAHELTHIIQDYQKRLSLRQVALTGKRPEHNSMIEIEARENARCIMHEILKYKDYIIEE